MSLGEIELKKAILEFLEKKGRWGGRYFSVDRMRNWMCKKVKPNGDRINKYLKELANERLIQFSKKGDTVSLNPANLKRIRERLGDIEDQPRNNISPDER